MTKCIGFKIPIKTNNRQNSMLTHWSNVRRFAYNYALGLSLIEQESLAEGEKWKLSRISEYDKMFNQGKLEFLKERKGKGGTVIGSGTHIWCQGVPASVSQQAIKYDLKSAWQRCFKKLGGRPKFQNKFRHTGFKLSNGDFKKEKNISPDRTHILHNKLGSMRLAQSIPQWLYEKGKLMNTTLSKKCDRWEVSFIFQIEDEDYYKTSDTRKMCVGVDLGVKHHATIYDKESGTSWHTEYPKDLLSKAEKRIKRLQKKVARQSKGSSNRGKTQLRINKLKQYQSNLRTDTAHKLSKELSTNSHKVVMEDLSVKKMTKSTKGEGSGQKRNLNREILNMGLYDLRMKMEYKCERYGSEFVLINPAYTSQTCNVCGHIDKNNRKTQERFECTSCGHKDNADVNAAKNIVDKATMDTQRIN